MRAEKKKSGLDSLKFETLEKSTIREKNKWRRSIILILIDHEVRSWSQDKI